MIREATLQDIEAISRLLEQVLAVHHAGRPDLFRASGTKYDARDLEIIIQNPHTPVFVYEDGSGVCGYIMCQEHSAEGRALMPVKTLYIDDLCIDERQRSKGIGRQLLEFATAYARVNGFHNITLHAWESNPGAMAFYKKMGFQPQYTCLETILD